MEELSIKEKRMMLVIMYLNQMVELGMISASPIEMTEEGIEKINQIKEEKIELPSEDIVGCLIAFGIDSFDGIMMAVMIDDLHNEGLDVVKEKIKLANENSPFISDNES